MIKNVSFLTAVCVFLPALPLLAQPGIQWQRSFGGSQEEFGGLAFPAHDGGYWLAGCSRSADGDVAAPLGKMDFWALKLDAQGNPVWQNSLGGSDDDWLTSAVPTHDGGIALAGYTLSNNLDVQDAKGLSDGWVVKLNANGVVEWKRTLGGSADDAIHGIVQTSDHGFVLVGGVVSNDGDISNGGLDTLFSDVWIIKLDSTGEKQWDRTYGGSSGELGGPVALTPDGGYFVLGHTNSVDGDVPDNWGGSDIWVLRLDSTGQMVWSKTFGGSFLDFATDILATPDGGCVFAGLVYSADHDVFGYHGGGDIWVVKLTAAGSIQWRKALGGSQGDEARSLRHSADGAFLLAGFSNSTNGDFPSSLGSLDAWVVKIKSNGAIQWKYSFGGESSDYAHLIVPTPDQGLLVSGRSYSIAGDLTQNAGLADLWVFKLDEIVGVHDDPLSTLSVYPNPVGQHLQWLLPENEIAIGAWLIDALGSITQLPANGPTGVLDLKNQAGGFYTLLLRTASGKDFVQRLLKF